MSDRAPPPLARVAVSFTIIAAILAAFHYRVATVGDVPPWLVGLVSVLGLGAGVAMLGSDAMTAGYEVFRGLR